VREREGGKRIVVTTHKFRNKTKKNEPKTISREAVPNFRLRKGFGVGGGVTIHPRNTADIDQVTSSTPRVRRDAAGKMKWGERMSKRGCIGSQGYNETRA